MEQGEMATTGDSITSRVLLWAFVFFLMCVKCSCVQAQKGLLGNLVKITTDQYGFIIGSNQKDTLYFITVTAGRVTNEDAVIGVIFFDGKANNKAKLVDQFEMSGKNLALYRYVGSTAKKVESKYFADFIVADHPKYSLMVDGAGGSEAGSQINPYVHKIHKATFQEMGPGKDELYYFNKSGGIVQQGMPLLHESGKAVVGIVADNDGAKGDRFSVIKIEHIAQRLDRQDRHTCRYFNLLRVGESHTPCEIEAIRREEERMRHIREDIERRNRTREQRREVRRTSDYWVSAGVTASYNWNSLGVQTSKGTESARGKSYSVGMSIYFNPNPKVFGGSVRPRYTSTSFNIPENYNVGAYSSLKLRKLSMESYEIPIIIERNGGFGLFFGIGYVPVFVTQTQLFYTISGETSERKDEIFGGPKYLHKLHLEAGIQIDAIRLGIIYQEQFGSTILNEQYEMIIDGAIVRPFGEIHGGNSLFSVELSYRLFSKWRLAPDI